MAGEPHEDEWQAHSNWPTLLHAAARASQEGRSPMPRPGNAQWALPGARRAEHRPAYR